MYHLVQSPLSVYFSVFQNSKWCLFFCVELLIIGSQKKAWLIKFRVLWAQSLKSREWKNVKNRQSMYIRVRVNNRPCMTHCSKWALNVQNFLIIWEFNFFKRNIQKKVGLCAKIRFLPGKFVLYPIFGAKIKNWA